LLKKFLIIDSRPAVKQQCEEHFRRAAQLPVEAVMPPAAHPFVLRGGKALGYQTAAVEGI